LLLYEQGKPGYRFRQQGGSQDPNVWTIGMKTCFPWMATAAVCTQQQRRPLL